MRMIPFDRTRFANHHDILSGPCRRPPRDSLGRKLVSETSRPLILSPLNPLHSNELNAAYAADGFARVKEGSVGAVVTTSVITSSKTSSARPSYQIRCWRIERYQRNRRMWVLFRVHSFIPFTESVVYPTSLFRTCPRRPHRRYTKHFASQDQAHVAPHSW